MTRKYTQRHSALHTHKGAVWLLSLAGFFGGVSSVCGEEIRKPNILFIAVDDLRPQLGCYGCPQIISPNIDKLAAEGTLFERNYCQAAHCCPSRASLMTGLRPDAAGVITSNDPYFRDFIPNVVTLPQYFATNGYHTVKVGKLFHNNQDPQSWQTILNEWRQPDVALYNDPVSKAKFKNALETIDKMVSEGKHLEPWERVHMMLSTSSESADVPDNAYPDGAITDLAIQALRKMKESGEPTFLGVGWYKPHLPFNCPSKYWKLYDPETIQLADNPFPPEDVPPEALHNWDELRVYADIPRTGPLSNEQARRLIHGYYACVSFADAQVGRVLRELDELGLTDNTIVVLWGDHGWHLGDHGMWCKQSNFETATHAPLIIRVPGMLGGQRVNALTEFVDVYPTLCDLAGLPVPVKLDGRSLRPLLDNPDIQSWKPAALSQYPRGEFIGRSMRTDRYRFTVWEHSKTREIDAMELYDHATDPEENVNIVNRPESAGLVKELMKQYRVLWKLPSDAPPVSAVIDFTADEGYTDGDLRNNEKFGWSGSPGAFVVDSVAGTVSISGEAPYKEMVYRHKAMSSACRAYDLTGTFSFRRRGEGALSKNCRILSVDFRDGPLSNSQNMRLQIRRLQDGGSYDISILEASGSTTFTHSTAVSENQLGLGPNDDLSDLLALTFQLRRGKDESDWRATGILSDVNSGKELVRLKDVALDTDAGFYENPVYIGFSALDANKDTKVSDITLNRLDFSSVR